VLSRFATSDSSVQVSSTGSGVLVAPSEGAKVAAPAGATVPPVDGTRWPPTGGAHRGALARKEQLDESCGASAAAAPLAGKSGRDFGRNFPWLGQTTSKMMRKPHAVAAKVTQLPGGNFVAPRQLNRQPGPRVQYLKSIS